MAKRITIIIDTPYDMLDDTTIAELVRDEIINGFDFHADGTITDNEDDETVGSWSVTDTS